VIAAAVSATARRALTKKFEWAPQRGAQILNWTENGITVKTGDVRLGSVLRPSPDLDGQAVVRVEQRFEHRVVPGVAIAVFDAEDTSWRPVTGASRSAISTSVPRPSSRSLSPRVPEPRPGRKYFYVTVKPEVTISRLGGPARRRFSSLDAGVLGRSIFGGLVFRERLRLFFRAAPVRVFRSDPARSLAASGSVRSLPEFRWLPIRTIPVSFRRRGPFGLPPVFPRVRSAFALWAVGFRCSPRGLRGLRLSPTPAAGRAAAIAVCGPAMTLACLPFERLGDRALLSAAGPPRRRSGERRSRGRASFKVRDPCRRPALALDLSARALFAVSMRAPTAFGERRSPLGGAALLGALVAAPQIAGARSFWEQTAFARRVCPSRGSRLLLRRAAEGDRAPLAGGVRRRHVAGARRDSGKAFFDAGAP